jgi:hypothetical protein
VYEQELFLCSVKLEMRAINGSVVRRQGSWEQVANGQ